MKNFKYITLSILCAGSFVLTGCLDEEPLYSQNNKVIFSSESNVEQALLGCYGYMTAPNAYGQQWQELPISASGLAWTQRNGQFEDGNVSLNADVSSTQASLAWEGMYKVIAEVNAFLDNLSASGLEQEVKIQKSLEARFLRALAYYNLVTLYGDVPLKTSASSSDAIAVSRTPAERVFELIVDDFKAATGLTRAHEDGRADAMAAKAYLGKVYHKMACLGINTQENLANAKSVFDEVYGKYTLENKYSNLFVDFVKNSKESIFQLNFNSESTVCFNRGANRFAPSQSTAGIAWGTYKSTKLAYDLMQGTYPGDPRIEETFLTSWRYRGANNKPTPPAAVGDALSANDSVYSYPYIVYTVKGDYVFKNGNNTNKLRNYVVRLPYQALTTPCNPSANELKNYRPDVVIENENNVVDKEQASILAVRRAVDKTFTIDNNQNTAPYFKKMYDEQAVGTRSHKNLIVYRYAEMLLLMADVYNELGNSQRAVELANEVLARARQSGKNASQPADWPAGLKQDQVREKLYFERVFEFIGEPNMYDMTRLKGTAYLKELLELHNDHHITKVSAERYAVSKNVWLDRIYNDGNLTEDFLKKNLLMPIPQSEIDANSSISNQDNNFGYK